VPVPERKIVPVGLLEALAGTKVASKTNEEDEETPAPPKAGAKPGAWTKESVDAHLRKGFALAEKKEPFAYEGGWKWQMDCPFDESHKCPDAFAMWKPGDEPNVHCSHNSCAEWTQKQWQAKWSEASGEKWPQPDYAAEAKEIFGAEILDPGLCAATAEGAAEAEREEEQEDAGEHLDASLVFPEECMYGRAGDLARQMRTPLGLAYPALVAAFSVIPAADTMLGTRLNIYCGLIAAPEAGKNESIKRALAFAEVPDLDYRRSAVGGDMQLAVLLGDKPGKKKGEPRIPGPRRKLLVNNELTDVLKKTGIDNSTLASRLCDLWDENEYDKPSDRGTIFVDCRLSWIGGIPADEKKADRFTELFGLETNFGLYPRFVFGYSGGEWTYVPCDPPARPQVEDDGMESDKGGEADQAHLVTAVNGGMTTVTDVEPAAKRLLDNWIPPVVGKGRLRYNLMKWAILTAAINGERRVTTECARKAIQFMEWQVSIRRKFRPGEADDRNREAQMSEKLIAALKDYDADTHTERVIPETGEIVKEYKFVSWRRISADRKWAVKTDHSIILRTITNLDKMGVIKHELYDDDNGKPIGSKIRLVTRKAKRAQA